MVTCPGAGPGKSAGTCNHSALLYFLFGCVVSMTCPTKEPEHVIIFLLLSPLHRSVARAAQRNKTRNGTKHTDYMFQVTCWDLTYLQRHQIWHVTKQNDYMSRRICWNMAYLLRWVYAGMGLIHFGMPDIMKIWLVTQSFVWLPVLGTTSYVRLRVLRTISHYAWSAAGCSALCWSCGH